MNGVFKQIVFFILKEAAKIQLYKIKPTIVAVGGSSGKTSLANLITIILSHKYKVKNSSGKNSHTGIPLSILDINPGNYTFFDWIRITMEALLKILTNWKRYDFFVAEMGIDGPIKPNNMSYLLSIITPDIAVLTNISHEHSVYFEESVKDTNFKKKEEEVLKLITKEENLLLSSVSERGIAVINLDDKLISKNINLVSQNRITASLKDKNADVFVSRVSLSLISFKISIIYKNEEYLISIKKPLPKHYASSFALAIALSLKLGINIKEAITSLEKNFLLPPGRMSIFEGVKETTIIDSSYNNATLPPILDLLEFLSEAGGKRRKVAIIGDMRELGFMSEKLHKIVAEKIIKTADLAILVGPLMRKYAAPVLKDKVKYKSFIAFTEAKKELLDLIDKNDLILVKSSQNTLFLERVVEYLLKDKKNTKYLCRRGSIWDLKRAQTK